MANMIHTKKDDLTSKHVHEHADYEYYEYKVVRRKIGKQCVVSVYEVPPGKAAYPYHWHTCNEEVFYILSGTGILKEPEGERAVAAGDFLYFPAEESGAHKLINTSEKEMLVYIDFDTKNEVDITFYPDSKKIGIWGKNTNLNILFSQEDEKEYYDSE